LVIYLFVSFPLQGYDRIVSISPVVTEIIYQLNAANKLVGVTNVCNYPAAALKLPKIGDFTNPNLEKVLLLKPDLVLGMGNPNSPGNLKLKELGVKSVVLNSPQTINEIYSQIQLIGQLTDKPAQAQDLIKNLKHQVALFKQSRPKKPKSILVVIWAPPITVAAQNTFINELIELAGYKNVIQNSPIQFPVINAENILLSQPQVILLGQPDLLTLIRNNPALKQTPAIKNNQIINTINPDLFLRPGPRFIEGVRQLRKYLRA
jgi:iron complex transport system substrate-binding protein